MKARSDRVKTKKLKKPRYFDLAKHTEERLAKKQIIPARESLYVSPNHTVLTLVVGFVSS